MGDAAARSRYRPDIDGLRAVAVVAVVLCHLGVRGVPGGFLGVDVFFVISGALIHRDLAARLAAGRLSVPAFYGRRIRRTLPALAVAAALTTAVALFVLFPPELKHYARSLLAALGSVPNLWFLSQIGYFDADAATKPLLHTWSLGVEEQFYLVAPLLALGLRPLAPRGRKAALLAGFVAAFAVAVLVQRLAPAAAFYLMPTRVFEFLIGAMVAEWSLLPTAATPCSNGLVRSPVAAEIAAGAALAGLAGALLRFGPGVPHPSWPTLLPCLSTAALIALGTTRRPLATKLLASPPLVAVGRISYSLYLYHWPILVLADAAQLPTTLPWRAAEIGVMVGVSVLSYRYVEQPFRAPGSPWRRRAPVLLPAAAAVLATICVAVLGFGGLPGRFPPGVDAIAAFADYRDTKPFREGRCFVTSRDGAGSFDRTACLALAPGRPNVLLIGDSHAAHLWTGLRDAWPGINVLQATASGCKPVLAAAGETRCTALMHAMFERFVTAHRLDAVVLAALWTESDAGPLRDTLEALRRAGQAPVVFGPLPRYDLPVATLLARAVLHGDLDIVARHRLPGAAALDARLRAVVAPLGTYVSTFAAMCPDASCRLFAAPTVPMQFDYHHLTAQGAAVLMKTVKATHPDLFGVTGQGRLDLSRD